MRAVVALSVLALVGCGGGATAAPSQNEETEVGTSSLKIVEVYRPKWDEYIECAVLIDGSGTVALDCNW